MARIYAQDSNTPCWRAIAWYDRAAENGDAQAMYELGKLYQTSRCGGNLQQAAFWLGAGVRFGSQESQAEAEKLNSRLTPAQKKIANREVERWVARYSAQKKDDDDD
jgi:TPR repeat protein